ncbi:MAG: AraC family transcriptional regulator [Lachnospiraceae bacterium]|jgi:two-component system response regulator YesN|nr:AraC family transcriptional regulator [Lachnospiraceae bacterium]
MYQVLIVDDEPIVKIALRSMIDWNALGFHICATTSNGEEALEMTHRFHPDLIICDLKMPVMDGLELIKEIKKQEIPCEFLVISNYEDFNYVRTALVLGAADYILKVSISPEELTMQLQKIREKLDQKAQKDKETMQSMQEFLLHQERHAAWRDFFTDKNYELDMLCSVTGLSLEGLDSLALCQISFDWYTQNLEPLPSIDIIQSTLKNALEHFDKRHIILFSTSNTLLVLPQSELYKHQSTIEGVAARISQLFQYYMSLSPAILYQSQIPDLIKARQTYHHFQEILELNFYGPIGQLDISSLTIASEVPMLSYKELTSEILSIPTSSRFAYASQRLAELLELCHQQHVMPSRVIQYFVRFLGELEYRTYGVSSAAHDQIADSTDSMRKALTEEELRKDLHNALQSILAPEQSCSTQPLEYSLEVTQALSYIQTSYQHKISLTSVSEHVGLSSGYLCRIFKEETGLSINAYINNLRMTKAGELLKDKNSYIKEVAAAVGFEDQLYFSRLFKRYYGITPSEYRLNE